MNRTIWLWYSKRLVVNMHDFCMTQCSCISFSVSLICLFCRLNAKFALQAIQPDWLFFTFHAYTWYPCNYNLSCQESTLMQKWCPQCCVFREWLMEWLSNNWIANDQFLLIDYFTNQDYWWFCHILNWNKTTLHKCTP